MAPRTTCKLDTIDGIHNMRAGTWPTTVTVNGQLVIANTRKCTCGEDAGHTVYWH